MERKVAAVVGVTFFNLIGYMTCSTCRNGLNSLRVENLQIGYSELSVHRVYAVTNKEMSLFQIGISFFKFPIDRSMRRNTIYDYDSPQQELQDKWLKALRLTDEEWKKLTKWKRFVCSLHFEERYKIISGRFRI